jgi:hypothetical protein
MHSRLFKSKHSALLIIVVSVLTHAVYARGGKGYLQTPYDPSIGNGTGLDATDG